MEPIFNIEGLQYDSICILCCPKGTRPGAVGDPARAILVEAGFRNSRPSLAKAQGGPIDSDRSESARAILVAAGISSQEWPADSDSSESSSSSDGARTMSVKVAAADTPQSPQ